jgi:hypothetical protein
MLLGKNRVALGRVGAHRDIGTGVIRTIAEPLTVTQKDL